MWEGTRERRYDRVGDHDRRDDHRARPDPRRNAPRDGRRGPCARRRYGRPTRGGRPARSADDRAAQDERVVGVGVTGEIEVALTEEFDTTTADQAESLAVGDTDGQAAVLEFAEAGEGEAVDIEETVAIAGVVEGDA